MGVQGSWEYEVKSRQVKALKTMILSLPSKINPWLPMECQFVCRDTVPQIVGLLGNLSSFPKVFEFVLMIEVKKNHINESARAMEHGVVPVVPWALWPLLSGCFRHNPVAGVYKNRKEKAKCLHTCNLQSVISCTQKPGRWHYFPSGKKTLHVCHWGGEGQIMQVQWDRKAQKKTLQRDGLSSRSMISLSCLIYKMGHL